MTFPSNGMGNFEFVKLATLRAAQLMKGCTARVPEGSKATTTAQREVAGGKVQGLPRGGGPAVPPSV